ncbi:MAG: phosphoenolpyruvate synthase [Lachnospiraceae bacterium]|nr:phosphoenolpyruvate synthase [Lachnospiraceae bacterium]
MTKADTLQYLKNHIENALVLPVLIIESDVFFDSRERTLERVLAFADGNNIVVRSSCKNEDVFGQSNAGKYDSILDVFPDKNDIAKAIEMVYHSYDTNSNEQILIQPMLKNIKKSGVVFTSDIDTGAPYYIVNYYDGNDTTAVTGGQTEGLKTYIRFKDNDDLYDDKDMKNLIKACHEIEKLFNNNALDIEFAITLDGQIHILQVRPLVVRGKELYRDIDLSSSLNRIYKKIEKLSKRHPFLLGKTTCFGVMPDWNPAEILGVRPKKLAISLYKELITDDVWAHQRYNYGYRDLTMHPLMVSFCGIPYIDTRITFNSFIPSKLNDRIAEKLADYYIKKLADYPKYHDKIEFEIVYSCYYLGLHEKLRELLLYGFNENEVTRIEFALLELTNNVINPKNGLYIKDIEKIKTLEVNYQKITDSDISLVDKIYWLLEECKEYGTLPFAGVARAAFIAVQFLKSFVDIGVFEEEDYNKYMNTLDTINRQMNDELKNLYEGNITQEEFLDKYGHIRPGTYDILSGRYDEEFDNYFSNNNYLNVGKVRQTEYIFTEEQKERIQNELDQNGLLITSEELILFIKESIEGREYLKFVFTKTVSRILQYIEELGIRAGIDKDDMAHIDISVIKNLYVDLYAGDISDIFRENINNNKKQYEHAVCIKLPSVIVKPQDVYAYYLLSDEPNFVTQKHVTADCVEINSPNAELEHKIVFVRAADPGYDYVFSKNIAALITQYGGANSHMAIRCAELGIPAVIGVGESKYNEWVKANRIDLDCMKRQVVCIE